MSMFCSIIIPTIGRSSLNKAIKSVTSQQFDTNQFELIVVNDSGEHLKEVYCQNGIRTQIINTNRRERSVARNSGAALARGKFLLFLDDDDWLLPNALTNLWQLADSTEAAWLYGWTQIVDRQSKPLIQLRHSFTGNNFVQVMAGEWIPLQSSIIRVDAFFSVGGFNPLLAGPEDIDLLRRIALHYDLAGTDAVVACVKMGDEGSTTNYDQHPDRSRWARELILDSSAPLFNRFRTSATSEYWQGRIVRAYLTSMVWNLQHKRLWTAVSRAAYGFFNLVLAGLSTFTQNFWRAVLKPYSSETFNRELQLVNSGENQYTVK